MFKSIKKFTPPILLTPDNDDLSDSEPFKYKLRFTKNTNTDSTVAEDIGLPLIKINFIQTWNVNCVILKQIKE